MPTIAEFVQRVEPLTPGARGDAVYVRFQSEPNLLAVAVVDAEGRPQGLVERNQFFLQMASHYGRALYARRPVESLMNPRPMLIEGGQDVSALFQNLDASQLGALLSGFVVVDQGRYVGVGTALHVLQAGYALNRKRADEMTRLAEDLAWAEAEAMASSRAKSQFLAVMSHEIRTPLNGVLGVAELMERKLAEPRPRPADLRPYVRTIVEAGQGLLRLLTDALDLSRADAGALTLEEQPFGVAGLARDLDALWRPLAEQKGLDYAVALDDPEGLWVLGDLVRLKQVFNNLIGNALKFTTEGRVEVSLSCRREDQCVRLFARVADSGPGVPDDLAPHIFEPFATGAPSAGAGLGLSICRQLVEQMDGRIALEPRPRGACFAFEVVLFHTPAQAGAAGEPNEPPTHHDTVHVLVVDDNPTNRFVACKLLEMFGATHETAENGLQAVEAITARHFDLVLMDVKMPVMDGVEATRRVRALSGPSAQTPIVALTANADRGDAELYLAAGMDEVAEKPIRPERLLDCIRRALTRAEEAGRQAA